MCKTMEFKMKIQTWNVEDLCPRYLPRKRRKKVCLQENIFELFKKNSIFNLVDADDFIGSC